MPQLAQDTFSAADGTALPGHNPAWTMRGGAFVIQSGGLAAGAANTECAAAWNALTFPADQYSQGTLAAVGSYAYIGVAVRVNGSGSASYYGYAGDNLWSSVFRVVNGVLTDLSPDLGGFTTGTTIRLEASAAVLTARVSADGGASWATAWTGTDSSISGGAAGLSGYGSSASTRLDGWSAGSLGADGHSLTASAITVGWLVLGQPGLAQQHMLDANGSAVMVAVLGQPAVRQVQQLLSLPLIGAGVMLPTPALVSEHGLAANPLVLAAVVLGNPRSPDTGPPDTGPPGAVAALRVAMIGAETRRVEIHREDRQQEVPQEERTYGISA